MADEQRTSAENAGTSQSQGQPGQASQGQPQRMDPSKLPPDLKPIYDSMLRDYRSKTEALAKERKEWEERISAMEQELAQWRAVAQAYQAYAAESSQADNQAYYSYQQPGYQTPNNGQIQYNQARLNLPEYYDPDALAQYLQQVLAQREQQWAAYAQYLQNQLLRASAYAIWAAALAAKDPSVADPRVMSQILTKAQETGGDLLKAYEAVMSPVKEKASLESQIKDLQEKLAQLQAQATPNVVGVSAAGRPISPPAKKPGQMAGHTGRYAEALKEVDLSKIIIP